MNPATRTKTAYRIWILCTFLILTDLEFCSRLQAQQNWDRFRGPNGSGLSLESDLPSKWTTEDYQWKVDLAGEGSSSPVIWDGKLFITSCDSDTAQLTLQCLDASTGKQLWQTKFESEPYRVHLRNSFASATPAVDAERVYVSYASPDHTWLVALDHDGNRVWERDFGTWISQHGFSVSPQVYKDKVIFFNSQQAERIRSGQPPGTSRVIAVYSKDGSDAWTAPLTPTRTCYAMPSVYTNSRGEEQLVSCNTGDGFFSLDPETGKKNWSALPFRMRTVASTLIANGVAIGSNGSGGGGNYLVAVRFDKASTDTAPEEIYRLPNANYVPSPVAVNGLLIFFTDKGVANCVDLQTGTSHWKERLAGGFSGSPVAIKDKVFVMDEDGNVYVVAAAKEFRLLGKHSLGESTRATPAIYGSRIYFRTETRLICIGSTK